MSDETPTDQLPVELLATRLRTLEAGLATEIHPARVVEIDGETFLKFDDPPAGLSHQQELGVRVTVPDAAEPPDDD
jgi:hypothetical protein